LAALPGKVSITVSMWVPASSNVSRTLSATNLINRTTAAVPNKPPPQRNRVKELVQKRQKTLATKQKPVPL